MILPHYRVTLPLVPDKNGIQKCCSLGYFIFTLQINEIPHDPLRSADKPRKTKWTRKSKAIEKLKFFHDFNVLSWNIWKIFRHGKGLLKVPLF